MGVCRCADGIVCAGVCVCVDGISVQVCVNVHICVCWCVCVDTADTVLRNLIEIMSCIIKQPCLVSTSLQYTALYITIMGGGGVLSHRTLPCGGLVSPGISTYLGWNIYSVTYYHGTSPPPPPSSSP